MFLTINESFSIFLGDMSACARILRRLLVLCQPIVDKR